MTVVSLKEQTEIPEYYEVAQIYPFTRWTPDVVNWIRIGEESSLFREPCYSTFRVSTIDLPLVTDKWTVMWPGHSELSLEDLRAGHLPKPNSEELTARKEAIKAAREIREKLNICPLTTSAIIRQLRHGSEKE